MTPTQSVRFRRFKWRFKEIIEYICLENIVKSKMTDKKGLMRDLLQISIDILRKFKPLQSHSKYFFSRPADLLY